MNIMTKMFSKLVKAIAQGALVAFALLSMPASAATTFELDFGCTPDGGRFVTCTDGTDAGGGIITFPELGPASPAAPFPGVSLDLTFLPNTSTSLSFTEADITFISWTISPDMSTLTYLNLRLDTDPLYEFGDIGEHQLASVSISMDSGGTWDAASQGCTSDGCFTTLFYENRTTTASPVVVPVPAAVWLFGSGMLGLIGVARRNKAA